MNNLSIIKHQSEYSNLNIVKCHDTLATTKNCLRLFEDKLNQVKYKYKQLFDLNSNDQFTEYLKMKYTLKIFLMESDLRKIWLDITLLESEIDTMLVE